MRELIVGKERVFIDKHGIYIKDGGWFVPDADAMEAIDIFDFVMNTPSGPAIERRSLVDPITDILKIRGLENRVLFGDTWAHYPDADMASRGELVSFVMAEVSKREEAGF